METIDDFSRLTSKEPLEQSKLNITVEMVKGLLSDLKVHKSPGPGWLHPRFMQELATELCKPLEMIFEKSIETAKLPKQWKIARVSAIFKKGNKKLANNYRPISITSIVCRTFEKIIRTKWCHFLWKLNCYPISNLVL